MIDKSSNGVHLRISGGQDIPEIWKPIIWALLFLSFAVFTGCMQFALRMSPTLFPNFAASIFEECDPELAKDSIPANLKLMEGLLRNDPKNKQILTTLSMGFSGYSMLFVEGDNPERASDLYLRARDYGIRAFGKKGDALKDPEGNRQKIQAALKNFGMEELEPLFWTTMSWNAWINLNLDRPAALAQLTLSQTCLERIMEIDSNYLYGLPRVLKGVSLAARPQMFGGDIKLAKDHFEKALELSDRKFFLTQYYFARYYAVRVQDKNLFNKLIKEILNGNPRELEDVCLINRVIQHQTKKLREMADELFF